MPRVTVKSTVLELKAQGPWLFGKKKTFEVHVKEGWRPVSVDGSHALTPDDLIDAIKQSVPGEEYMHSSLASKPGKIGSIDAFATSGTEATLTTHDGAPLATEETVGQFMIQASTPSMQPSANGEIPDPVMMFTGKWRVKDPGQERFSEKNGPAAVRAPTEAPSVQHAATQDAGDDVEDEAATEAPPMDSALSLHIRLVDTEESGDLTRIWGPAMVQENRPPLRGAMMALTIKIAQLRETGGVVGRFHRSVPWSSLLDTSGAALSIEGSLAMLPPTDLEPDRPVWIAIEGFARGAKAPLSKAAIGGAGAFAPARESSKDLPFLVVRPDDPPKGFRFPETADDVWRPAKDVLGTGDRARAVALFSALNVDEQWTEFDSDPTVELADWSVATELVECALDRVAEEHGEDDKGKSYLKRAEHYAPIEVPLAPRFPALLALRAATLGLEERTDLLNSLNADRSDRLTHAWRLENLLRQNSPVTERVQDGLHWITPPDTLFVFNEESGGLTDWSGPDRPISASRLYLLAHYTQLRAEGAALRKAASNLLYVLCAAKPGTLGVNQALEEERVLRLSLGVVALEKIEETGEASLEDTMLSHWLIDIARRASPDWNVRRDGVVTGVKVFAALSSADRLCGEAGKGGEGFSKNVPPLLSEEDRGEFLHSLDEALGAADALLVADMHDEQKCMPGLVDARSALNDLKTRAKQTKKVAKILERLAQQGVLDRVRRTDAHLLKTVQDWPVISAFVLQYSKTTIRQRLIYFGRDGFPIYFWARSTTTRKLKFAITWYRPERLVRRSLEAADDLDAAISSLEGSNPFAKELLLHGTAKDFAKRVGAVSDTIVVVSLFAKFLLPLQQEHEPDPLQQKLEIGIDTLTLANVALQYGKTNTVSIKAIQGMAKKVTGPLIAFVSLMLATHKARVAFEEGRFDDARAETLNAAAAILSLSAFLPLSPGVIAICIAGSLVLGVAAAFAADEIEEDLKQCHSTLEATVRGGPFGSDGFRELASMQPAPQSLVERVEKPSGINIRKPIIIPPSDADRKWVHKVRNTLLPFDETLLRQTEAATAACSLTMKPVLVSLDQCSIAPETEWLGWFRDEESARACCVTISLKALADLGSSLRFYPNGSFDQSGYHLKIGVEPSEDPAVLDIRATPNRGLDFLPVGFREARRMGGKRTDGKKPVRGGVTVLGLAFPGGKTAPIQAPIEPGLKELEFLFILQPSREKIVYSQRPRLLMTSSVCPSPFERWEQLVEPRNLTVSIEADGSLTW